MDKLPLEGIRVADFSYVGAGPWCARHLSIMGAEVIKVESHRRLDINRTLPPFPDGIEGLNRSGILHAWNDGKKSCSINFDKPEGAALARELVKHSDVMVTNLGSTALEKFGLDYEALKKVKPDLIMATITAFGATGPQRDWVGYGRNLQAAAGTSNLIGYEGGPPLGLTAQLSDPLSGITACFSILCALHYRSLTGIGQYIDVSMNEAVVVQLAEPVMDYLLNGREWERAGNRTGFESIRGCYRCLGDDKWVAITIAAEDWKPFIKVLGEPAWAAEPRFADPISRRQHQDELDSLIQNWTQNHTAFEVMELLQKNGIPAGACKDVEELTNDEILWKRGVFVMVDQLETGRRGLPGIGWVPSGAKPRYSATPNLGGDNEYVFLDLLKMSKDEYDRLVEAQVIW